MEITLHLKQLVLLLLMACIAIVPLPTAGQVAMNWSKIDRHAQNAPKKWQQDLPLLTQYLTEATANDFEKVRAIYRWITLNISYDTAVLDGDQKRINKNISDILARQKAICMGYADLFKKMCELAGLSAQIIDGYSKGTLTSKPDLSTPDHSWNAVLINKQWYLIDATWGSSLLQQNPDFTTLTEDYFLSSPDQFILTHLPAMPMWQLLECPISTNIYKENMDSIKLYLQSCTNTFVYQDSIKHFLALTPPEQRLQAAAIAYHFNQTPKNKQAWGHALMDFAGILSDSIDLFQPSSQLAEIIDLQEKIIHLCETAHTHISMHQWQKELYAGAIINLVVARFQQAQTLDPPPPNLWEDLINMLETAKAILQTATDSYFTQMASKQCAEYIAVLKDYAR
ncbi:MAG: transglutaminase domain-containing protein [Saprospiraceae bacterium]